MDIAFIRSTSSLPASCVRVHLLPSGQLPSREGAAFAAWLKSSSFSGRLGECEICPPTRGGAAHIFVGLGKAEEGIPATWQKTAQMIARTVRSCRASAMALIIAPVSDDLARRMPDFLRAFTVGLHAGAYEFRRYLKDRPTPMPALRHVSFVHPEAAPAVWRAACDEGKLVGRGLEEVRDLANLPGNEAPPRVIADEAAALARRRGLRCTVWGASRLRKEKCEALLAVAQGSAEKPRLIILEHAGTARKLAPIVLVGKTITFDTGGISIKPAKNMEWMRYDKSGGMAVLAAMNMIAAARIPRPVIGILAVAENMPGGRATRPGDIVRSRSGRTIEIINTDAEGRLVLADALSVAQDYEPAAIIDLATLTGAAVVALGHVVSAVMGNRPSLVQALQDAGDASGDRVWPLPLHPEYLDMLRSPFADLRNTGDGTAGAIAGGLFLRQFVDEDVPWAHIDLTNAWEERDQGHAAAGANLYGAKLVFEWIRHLGVRSRPA